MTTVTNTTQVISKDHSHETPWTNYGALFIFSCHTVGREASECLLAKQAVGPCPRTNASTDMAAACCCYG